MRKDWFEKIRDEEDFDLLFKSFYEYWEEILSNIILSLFKYDNLPFPQHELELRAMKNGYAGVVKDDKIGIMAAWGGMSGATEYSDYFTNFTYSAPTAKGGTKKIGKDAVILRNTSIGTPSYILIKRTAFLLAHNDVSLKMALINCRYQDIIRVNDDSKKDTVEVWYKGLYEGRLRAIIDDYDMAGLFSEAGNGNVFVEQTTSVKTSLREYLEVTDELLRQFYLRLGIRWNKDKKANLVAGEVEQDNMLLELNVSNMLEERKKFCEEYNRVFKSNISVRLTVRVQENVLHETNKEESSDKKDIAE